MPFEVWPNPALDQVAIQLENTNDFLEISIFDLQGHQVQQTNNILPGDEMNISSIPSGIYMLQVSNGKETGTKKLIKE